MPSSINFSLGIYYISVIKTKGGIYSMKVERVNTSDGYMVSMKDDNGAVEIQLSVKDALDLSDALKNEAMSIIDEACQLVIVPKILKTLIDCGKVARLHYSHQTHNEDTGLELFSIRAVFTDNSSKSYFHECKFSDNPTIREEQLKYVSNIPIYVGPNDIYPSTEIDESGRHGYNIVPTTEDAINNVMDKIRDARKSIAKVSVVVPKE